MLRQAPAFQPADLPAGGVEALAHFIRDLAPGPRERRLGVEFGGELLGGLDGIAAVVRLQHLEPREHAVGFLAADPPFGQRAVDQDGNRARPSAIRSTVRRATVTARRADLSGLYVVNRPLLNLFCRLNIGALPYLVAKRSIGGLAQCHLSISTHTFKAIPRKPHKITILFKFYISQHM
jgi:hypothetical protein